MFRATLLLVQMIGLVLSAYLVYVTFFDQAQIERKVQSYAIVKAETATTTALDKITGVVKEGGAAAKLGALAQRLRVKASELTANRETIVPSLVRDALAAKCDGECPTPEPKRSISRALIEKLSSLRVGENKVQDYIVERYESSVQGLITDLRRFGLVNMMALSLMMALVFFRDRLSWKISAFSTVLTGYIAWAAYGYVYQQDWISAFLFKDWAAPLYQLSMIFVSIILADWLFLKGRITQFIIDAIGNITNLISSAIP